MVNEPLKVPSAAMVTVVSVDVALTSSTAPGMPVPVKDVGVLTVLPPVGVETMRSGTAAHAAVGNKPPNARIRRTRNALHTCTQASLGMRLSGSGRQPRMCRGGGLVADGLNSEA